MADLTFRTAATLIERALFDAVNLALRKRLPPAADVAALRAVATRGAGSLSQRLDHELVYVSSKGRCYRWAAASTAADDGDATVKPTDVGAASGRWLKTTSSLQAGYLLDVRLYEGEQSEKELLDRLLSQRPSVLVRWERSSHEPKSQVPGALYRYESDFDVWVVSSNMRGNALPEAVVGSQVAAEFDVDPGANAIVGDVKAVLAGSDLGQPGVAYCEVGAEEPLYRSLAERRFVYSLGVRVHATVANPDSDLVALESVRVAFELADRNATDPPVTRDDCVTTRVTVTVGGGLVASVSPGVARVGGVAVSYAGEPAHAFDALSWTYRDLAADGTMTFVATPPFAEEPAVTPGALRVGVTYTDASDVVGDAPVAATLEPFGDEYEVPKP